MSNAAFISYDILKVIQNENSKKALDLDKTSTKMLKIRMSPIWKPLETIFQSYLESGALPLDWKKVIVVPVHGK